MKAFRRDVRALAPYTLEEPELPVKVNQNESPWDWPEELKARALSELGRLPFHRYPPFRDRILREALAERFGLDPRGILVGNGSNELLQTLFTACLGPRRTLLLPEPTFSLYRQMALLSRGRAVAVPLSEAFAYDGRALLEAVRREEPAVVLLCSPNNPTGTVAPPDLVLDLCRACRGIVAVDEAYGEFAGGEGTVSLLLRGARNLVVLRTFSKAWGSAALRLGYLLAPPEAAREIAKALLPYNVSPLTASLGAAALREGDLFEERVRRLKASRERLFRELGALPGVEVFPSGGNFLLVRLGERAREVYLRLKERGILVRDVSAAPRLAGCLRFTVGSEGENGALLRALGEILP